MKRLSCKPPMTSTRIRSFRMKPGTRWPRLYSRQQMMDLVFSIGQYNLVSWALNSFGVPLDPFLPGAQKQIARKLGSSKSGGRELRHDFLDQEFARFGGAGEDDVISRAQLLDARS